MPRSVSHSLFQQLKTDTPVPLAGSTVLSEQLRHFRSSVESVDAAGKSKPEAVHQLRVAARRLRVSLKVFSPFLHEASVATLKKKVRKVFRRAGDVRDIDVLLACLDDSKDSLPDEVQSAIRRFEKWLVGRRRDSVPDLREAVSDLNHKKFWTWSSRNVGHGVSGKNRLTWGQVAVPSLAKRLQEVLEAEPEALTGAEASLHELRIAFKGLRYSLDIFGGCFTTGTPAALQSSLVQMQDTLGALNDISNWIRLCDDFRHETGAKKKARVLRDHFESLLESQKQEALRILDRDWSPDRRTPLLKNLVLLLPEQ